MGKPLKDRVSVRDPRPPHLTIVVRGKPMSGKSTVITLLSEVLADEGFRVTLRTESFKKHFRKALGCLRGYRVEILEEQAPRV